MTSPDPHADPSRSGAPRQACLTCGAPVGAAAAAEGRTMCPRCLGSFEQVGPPLHVWLRTVAGVLIAGLAWAEVVTLHAAMPYWGLPGHAGHEVSPLLLPTGGDVEWVILILAASGLAAGLSWAGPDHWRIRESRTVADRVVLGLGWIGLVAGGAALLATPLVLFGVV